MLNSVNLRRWSAAAVFCLMDDVPVALDCVLQQTALYRVILDHEYLPCPFELIVTGHCRLTSCET